MKRLNAGKKDNPPTFNVFNMGLTYENQIFYKKFFISLLGKTSYWSVPAYFTRKSKGAPTFWSFCGHGDNNKHVVDIFELQISYIINRHSISWHATVSVSISAECDTDMKKISSLYDFFTHFWNCMFLDSGGLMCAIVS